MEDAPTPKYIYNKDEIQTYIDLRNSDILYEVSFKPKDKEIKIECANTGDNSNEKYYYKLTEEEIIRACGNIINFLDKLKTNLDKIELEKNNDTLLLIIFLGEKWTQKKLILQMQLSEEEIEIDEEITNIKDAVKYIKLLIEENKKIKNELNKVKNNFKEYKAKMDLNLLYSSFDPNVYKLDNIYKHLSSKIIIQNEMDFCLINQGIHHLFKKNIINFESLSEYDSQNMYFDFDKFKKLFNESDYSVLIILTKGKKRFGAFYNNKKQINEGPPQGGNNPFGSQQGPPPGGNPYGSQQGPPPGGNPYGSQQGNNLINNQQDIIMGNKIYNNNLQFNHFQGIQINNQMNLMQNQNMNTPKIVFNSSSSEKEYFVFSLDSSQIFYSNNNLCQNKIPGFSINFEEEILKGYETIIGNDFNLAGTQKFNIIKLELYSIQFGYL